LQPLRACERDPEKWYSEHYGEEPNYSSLLDRLAPTPALRQQLLRSYFEPTEDQRDEGKKLPTRAHHAIASLVRSGALRVIITTNFDRLIETALEAGGITPTIISSPDDVDGATPIVHSGCTVIKVHGDYCDTRIKNSPSELETYDDRINRLLDRVLDEFGLVVCGWSADYDTALRAAIRRTPSRRYPMFWTKRGKLSPKATSIIKFRKANTIEIDGADDFVGRLEEKHEAIARYGEPHPLSKAAAQQTLKRYMSDERFTISLHDFVKEESRRAKQLLTSHDMLTAPGTVAHEMLAHRLRSYE
jgi:SIR2-like domain